MTAYALIAPTIVEAVQSPVSVSQKVFGQRLSQTSGEAQISAVVVANGSALPRFAQD